jgi:hypothetical protein
MMQSALKVASVAESVSLAQRKPKALDQTWHEIDNEQGSSHIYIHIYKPDSAGPTFLQLLHREHRELSAQRSKAVKETTFKT